MNKCAKTNPKALLPYQLQLYQWLVMQSAGQTTYLRKEQGGAVKLVKLDRRHTAHGIMTYYVDPVSNWAIGYNTKFEQFQRWRNWCWEVFGPGVERQFLNLNIDINRWCWYSEYDHLRLYFKDDETASAFMFQWSK